MEAAREEAVPESREAGVLDRILENARIGVTDGVPICQDTGSVWVCLEVGEKLAVPGNIFSRVNDAVARAYTDGHLRMSLVRDALFDRANTGDNTPAFCELKLVPGDQRHPARAAEGRRLRQRLPRGHAAPGRRR